MSNHITLYTDNINKHGITTYERNVLKAMCIPSIIDYNTNWIRKKKINEIAAATGYSFNSIHALIARLKRKMGIIEFDKKLYINPLLIWRGPFEERTKTLSILDLKDNGQNCMTSKATQKVRVYNFLGVRPARPKNDLPDNYKPKKTKLGKLKVENNGELKDVKTENPVVEVTAKSEIKELRKKAKSKLKSLDPEDFLSIPHDVRLEKFKEWIKITYESDPEYYKKSECEEFFEYWTKPSIHDGLMEFEYNQIKSQSKFIVNIRLDKAHQRFYKMQKI